MYYNNKNYQILGLYLFIICILAYIFFYFFRNKEGFSISFNNNFVPWPKDLVRRFKIYQATVGENNYQYNMYILQQQASADEAEELLRTGHWPWSDNIKEQYMDAISKNVLIEVDPGEALDNARKIYNQNAIKEMLAFNSKEGKFLIYGTVITNNDPDSQKYGVFNGNKLNPTTIRCSDDLHTSVLQKKVFNGYNFYNGYKNTTTTTLKNEDIPTEVAGFSFVNGPCNPCDYNCPFKIDVGNGSGDKITSIWADLWNLN
jgi:hypothetical protein